MATVVHRRTITRPQSRLRVTANTGSRTDGSFFRGILISAGPSVLLWSLLILIVRAIIR